MGQVHFGCAPGSAAALVSQLLAEGEILFLRCLEPEACFLHVVGELPYLIRSNVGSGFSCKQLGYILIGARAVKEAGQLPLHGLETEEIAFLALQHGDDFLAIKFVLAHHQFRIEHGRTPQRGARFGHLRKCGVEGFAKIHGARRTCICIPGFRSGDGLTTAPITCTLPLAGSTTGLTRSTRPRW